jgi:hypothetical protein
MSLDLVKKLIALATNDSAAPEEARTAAMQAVRLIVKEKIALYEQGNPDGYAKVKPSPHASSWEGRASFWAEYAQKVQEEIRAEQYARDEIDRTRRADEEATARAHARATERKAKEREQRRSGPRDCVICGYALRFSAYKHDLQFSAYAHEPCLANYVDRHSPAETIRCPLCAAMVAGNYRMHHCDPDRVDREYDRVTHERAAEQARKQRESEPVRGDDRQDPRSYASDSATHYHCAKHHYDCVGIPCPFCKDEKDEYAFTINGVRVSTSF